MGGAAIPLAQRGEDAERRHQRAAAEIGDLAGRLHGGTPALTREAEQADEAEVVHVVARGLPLGAALAVAGDRAVHDPGVDLAHPLVAHAEAVEDAGAEGLEHHVVLAHQAQQHLAPLLALEVDADRALVAVQREEERGLGAVLGALHVGRRPADVVAHAGVLHLQHLRPEVREQQRAEAAGQQAGEVEHADALEGEAHHARVSAIALGDVRRLRASRTVAGRRPTSSVICRAFATSSPLERAISPSGR